MRHALRPSHPADRPATLLQVAHAWPWDELVAMRHLFLTAVTLEQYLGFAKTHLGKAEAFLLPCYPADRPATLPHEEIFPRAEAEGGDEGATEEAADDGATGEPERPLPPDVAAAVSKCLYHAFHKLFESARLVRDEEPHVRPAALLPALLPCCPPRCPAARPAACCRRA